MEFDAFMKDFPCDMFPDTGGAVSDPESHLSIVRDMSVCPA